MPESSYDLVTMGRSSIDLYSLDLGAPFPDITRFAAYVGGSPTNIAVGARRLGLEVALLTAVGNDRVGEFVLGFLERESVATDFIPTKPGRRTSAVLLGVEPPDRFPLVFYRDNCADTELTIDDVLAAPLDRCQALEISGTGLAREPARSATLFAAERARAAGATVFLDLDFRADQWHDPRAFGLGVRSALRLVDVAVGTEEEVNAAMLGDPADLVIEAGQVSAPTVRGDVQANVARLLAIPGGPAALVVKRGPRGATIFLRDGEIIQAPGFPVEVVNVLGAGDAFASGLIYGRLQGWDWLASARMGNACGAILVTQHGCANFMPTRDEALEFALAHGGL